MVSVASTLQDDASIEKDVPAPPNWDLVAFPVRCSRCDADLHGRSDPVCPTCGLSFAWNEVAPVEHLTCQHCDYHLYGLEKTRCPECGKPFEWAEVLAAYHRKRLPLFEFQWRGRFFRSLLDTWRRALRPRRFWKNVSVHDPPQIKPLIIMTLVALFATALLLTIGLGVSNWWVHDGVDLIYWRLSNYGLGGQSFWSAVLDGLQNWIKWTPTSGVSQQLILSNFVWVVLSTAALFVYRQSMRRFKLRYDHTLRRIAFRLSCPSP